MTTDVLLEGLCFGEGPRWHERRLWFSDMYGREVIAVDEAGNRETMVRLTDDEPSGLGWLPDGTLLIVSMRQRKLLAWDGSALRDFADLSDLASARCNDMVTDGQGRSYVGNFGFDMFAGEEPAPAELVLVDSNGEARVVAEDLMFPNGTVITPDGKTLVVGESFAGRLTAFDIAEDGSLSNRRLWAQLEGALPDGICLDTEGGIWVASPSSDEVLRVLDGGEVTDRIALQDGAYACMLGGADGRTLFIATGPDSVPEECEKNRRARIETVAVDYPGAGWP